MSMNESSRAEKLKAAVMEANLAPQEIKRRLIERIEIEYEKGKQADVRLIDICERMLMQLETPTGEPFVSHKANIHQRIDDESGRETRRQHHWHFPMRAIAAAVAILVGVTGVGSLLHWKWIEHSSSYDEQQRIVKGYDVGIDVVQKAIAANEGATNITIDSVDKFEAYLGFEPGLPSTVDEKWTATVGFIGILPETIQIGMNYAHCDMPDRYMTYIRYYFIDPENAYITFEQDYDGEEVKLSMGSAYFSMNMGDTTACWQRGTTVSFATGRFDTQEGIKIVEELFGGV